MGMAMRRSTMRRLASRGRDMRPQVRKLDFAVESGMDEGKGLGSHIQENLLTLTG